MLRTDEGNTYLFNTSDNNKNQFDKVCKLNRSRKII